LRGLQFAAALRTETVSLHRVKCDAASLPAMRRHQHNNANQMKEKDCPKCDGKKKIETTDAQGGKHQINCPFCNGKGKVKVYAR